eukprot:456244-Pelagomonas_calceolata.AAC.1
MASKKTGKNEEVVEGGPSACSDSLGATLRPLACNECNMASKKGTRGGCEGGSKRTLGQLGYLNGALSKQT